MKLNGNPIFLIFPYYYFWRRCLKSEQNCAYYSFDVCNVINDQYKIWTFSLYSIAFINLFTICYIK
jgi:hypothetical protein